MALKDTKSYSLELSLLPLYGKWVFVGVIKLRLLRILFCTILVGPTCNHKSAHKRKAEEHVTEEKVTFLWKHTGVRQPQVKERRQPPVVGRSKKVYPL